MDALQKNNKIFLNPLTHDEIGRFQEAERRYANVSKERYGPLPKKNAFLLREGDVLQLASWLHEINFETKANGLHISRSNDNSAVVVDTALADLVDAILNILKKPLSCAELESALAHRWAAKDTRSVCEQLLDVCVECPNTIKQLEEQLALNSLIRFPAHSPYKLPRNYWENSIAVRRALPLLYDAYFSKEQFLKAVAGLHRIATVGESGENFYGGAGGLPTEPGIYRQQDIKTGIARWCFSALEWWLKFLKVPVKLIEEGTIKSLAKRPMVTVGMEGLQCMHLYDAGGVLLFKLLDEARDNLRSALESSKKGNVDIMLGQLARFLQLFAIAHPFNNINASIAMNVVNDVLEKQGLGRLPHLYLDYVAQRTRPSDFSLVFKAVFEKHRMTGVGDEADKNAEANMRCLLEIATLYFNEQNAALAAQNRRNTV